MGAHFRRIVRACGEQGRSTFTGITSPGRALQVVGEAEATFLEAWTASAFIRARSAASPSCLSILNPS